MNSWQIVDFGGEKPKLGKYLSARADDVQHFVKVVDCVNMCTQQTDSRLLDWVISGTANRSDDIGFDSFHLFAL